jgi:hypothetical protein
MVDHFILFDNVQYTERDWRNRNRVKTAQGITWLTVPIKDNSIRNKRIYEIEIDGAEWISSHLELIRRNYTRAKFYDEVYPLVIKLFEEFQGRFLLSDINEISINYIANLLKIQTNITAARFEFPTEFDSNEKLIYLCMKYNADFYLSGPSAKAYLDKDMFQRNSIQLGFVEYMTLQYHQPWGEFVPNLSILDALFNVGIAKVREVLK